MDLTLNKLKLPLPIAIVGYGVTGQFTEKFFKVLGVPEIHYSTYDEHNERAKYRDPKSLFETFQPGTLIVSPGVPLKSEFIQEFIKKGGRVTSELEIATDFLQEESLICITGALGKSTVASLLKAGLEAFSNRFFVGGNLGVPLIDYVTKILQRKIQRADWVVLELSSYQLENYRNLNPKLAIITYFAPNHLERYPSLEDYYQTKWTLAEKTSGPIILNSQSVDLVKFVKNLGPQKKLKLVWTHGKDPDMKSLKLENAKMVGSHNLDNLALAINATQYFDWPAHAIEAIKNFKGLEHRIENLGNRGGVQFINDSKATTITSVIQAIRASLAVLSDKGALYVLLGGRDKHLPWVELSTFSSQSRLEAVYFGEFAQGAKARSGLPGPAYESLKQALDHCKKTLKPGDMLLLSPGGTSLDEFSSFEERGTFFKAWVNNNWPQPQA